LGLDSKSSGGLFAAFPEKKSSGIFQKKGVGHPLAPRIVSNHEI
jgi:hypothetical protein